jgi:SNF2 family DNA or RNA helicase
MQKIIDLYYSPILDRFSKKKPKEVRGGIIAAEMGLGKTLISLALILKHPAPQLPISGSKIDALTIATGPNVENPSKWDKDLYAQSSAANPKRGSILSRGTLVICPKSLVGQWIEGM